MDFQEELFMKISLMGYFVSKLVDEHSYKYITSGLLLQDDINNLEI